ncbi:MAG: hypothetical protein J6K53_03960 [Roseburia sp.]|nr:hypothetical protein [Roseburia sp.]
MGQLSSNSAVGTYAADYQYRANKAETEKTKESGSAEKKSRVYGRTIGTPELSEKAKKYYEKLKAKYSNMDFILVSPDKKEEAERNKGMYASSKELLVLIDSDKIEKMAEDEVYRSKYEGILSMASAQVNQMKQELGSKGDSVRSVGMSFDDHGNASFFAVVDKSLAKQRERIEEKRAEAREDRKEAAKKADEKAKADKTAGKGDEVTVTASSWEELLKKIDRVLYEERADSLMTDAEKKVGQSFDYTI